MRLARRRCQSEPDEPGFVRASRLKPTLAALMIALSWPPNAGAAHQDSEQERLKARVMALDPAAIHRGVLAHEQDPLGETAEKIRPVLATYFGDADYVVCLDQVGFLLETDDRAHEAIFWQVVFASGDFALREPDGLNRPLDYMEAGLASALRAYENVIARNPRLRLERLDKLVTLRDQGLLGGFVKDNACE